MRQIYEIFIDLEDAETGVFFNSAVGNPAHEKAFYAFSKDEPIRCEFNDEKQNIIGVAISADSKIFRNHPELGEHYVVFTKDNVRNMAYKFMRDNNNNKLNFNHDGADISKSAIGFFSYIIDTANGFPAPKAFEGENEGSWLLGYHFTDKAEYERVKNNFTGWSVEGDFYQKAISKPTNMSETKNMFQKLMDKFSNKEEEETTTQEFESAKLADGTEVKWEGELAEGTALFVVTDEGDVPAPDGEHVLENGAIVVTEAGLVTTYTEAPSEDEEMQEETADEFEQQFSALLEMMFKRVEEVEAKVSAKDAEIATQKEQFEALKNEFEEFKKGATSAPEKKKFASVDNNSLNRRQRIMLQTLKKSKK